MKAIRKTNQKHKALEALDEFRKKFEKRRAQGNSPKWSEFNSSKRRRTPVTDQLRHDQGGLCAYCEIKLIDGDETVEHYVPARLTTPQKDWDLCWENLLLVCSGGKNPSLEDDPRRYAPPPKDHACCGSLKYNLDPRETPLLNPLTLPLQPSLFRVDSYSGELRAHEDHCREANIEPALVSDSVEHLGLNCPRLKDNRLALIAFLSELLTSMSEADLAAESFQDPNDWPEFFTTWRSFLGQPVEARLKALTIA